MLTGHGGGAAVRRAAEDGAPFRMLKDAVHAAALGRRIGPSG